MKTSEVPQRLDVLCGLLMLLIVLVPLVLAAASLHRLPLSDPGLVYMNIDPMGFWTISLR